MILKIISNMLSLGPVPGLLPADAARKGGMTPGSAGRTRHPQCGEDVGANLAVRKLAGPPSQVWHRGLRRLQVSLEFRGLYHRIDLHSRSTAEVYANTTASQAATSCSHRRRKPVGTHRVPAFHCCHCRLSSSEFGTACYG